MTDFFFLSFFLFVYGFLTHFLLGLTLSYQKNNSKQMSEYAMNRKSKQSILSGKANGSNKNSHVANNNTNENGQMSKKTAPTNDIRRKSMQQKNSIVIDEQQQQNQEQNQEQHESNDNGNCVTDNCAVNGNANKSSAKLNRQSSGETSISIDDVNNKLTSHAFQSYDEQEHLESKEIQSPTTENIPNLSI